MQTLIEHSFTVPVSVEVAWEYLAKVEAWPSWAKHIRRLELEAGAALGSDSKGVIYLQNRIKTTFSMTEFNLHQNWKWVGKFLWLTVHYDHRFRPVDADQCEMTFHVAAEGFGVGVVGRVFAMVYNRNLDAAVPNLVQQYQDMG